MKVLLRGVHGFVLAGVLLAAQAASLGGPNLYPDPHFQAGGVPGAGREGGKAGHLAVAAMNHWAAIGGQISVQPFARYRVTEWVKANVGQGTFYAPYCYDWDSYEWAFVSAHTVGSLKEWTQTEVSFVCPNPRMSVHPLAYIDAASSEGWVDDVVVEKIAEPEQVMAEMCAKAVPDDMEKRLIARWYVAQGKLDAAAEVLKSTEDLTRADIATVLAKATPDVAARKPLVVQVVAYGGPTYYGGMDRFNEISRGFSDEDKVAVCVEAAKLSPGLDRCARSVRAIVENLSGTGQGPLTVAQEASRLDAMRTSLGQALAAIPADSVVAKELQSAMKSVDQASAKVEERRAHLGRCVVRIAGRPVKRETHAIILPNRPTPQEEYAARDLRYHLELITGEALPIWREHDAAAATPLYVGNCEKTKAAGVDCPGLGLEGIHIKTVGPSVLLAGNQRGVGYAVSVFLEDYLDCRWFTPDCATWPRDGVVDVPEIDRRYLPPLEYRAGDYPIAHDGAFAEHLRLNGDNHWMNEEQGGRKGVHSLAHTFAALCPPEKYYKDHPEYFSLVNGQRQSGYAQLCLTNPEVLRICIEGVRRWIKENPQKKVFSVSQNDTGYYCECDNCRKVAEEEGSESGPVLRFVNAVADAIKDDYPDVAIETLAYQYTRKPPKITKPRPNVVVCLCSIECCFIHPLATDEFNRSFRSDIEGWSRICQRLWIWDYVINYAHSICPFPNLYVLRPNIDFFINNGVKGIYEESCYFTKGSELQELRNYVMSKALWDPSYDTDRAIDEFCAAFYGPAAPFVRQYVTLIHAATQKNPALHVQIYTHPRAYITPEMISASRALFDQAEAAAKDDPTFLHRVQVARLPMLYAEITLAHDGSLVERGDRLVQEGGTDVSALVAQFEGIARAEGVSMISEGGSFDAWLQSLPRRPRAIKIERLENPALKLAVLPELGGRIWRMQQAGSGRDLMRVAGSPAGYAPSEGGYEEYSEGEYHSPGWTESYSVRDRSDRGLTLEATLGNGLRLTRRLELDPEKPLLKITSSVTNVADGERTACLRAHPEFAVTSLDQASVRILGPDGKWRSVALGGTADAETWLRDQDVPAGAWAVVDEAAGLAILNRVPRAQLSQCLLDRSPSQHRVNLELYSPQVKLQPGQTLTLEHTYEVVSPVDKTFG